MELFYRRSSCGTVCIQRRVNLLGVILRTTAIIQDVESKMTLKGYIPVLVTSLWSDFVNVRFDSLINCYYTVKATIIDTTPYRSVKLNKRLRYLHLGRNGIQSMARCHCRTGTRKTKYCTIIPWSVTNLSIIENPVFRLVLLANLLEIDSSECESLRQTKYKEGIISIEYFMAYHRKPRSNQKSIRDIELSYDHPTWGLQNVYTHFGKRGVYNEFLRLTKTGIKLKHKD